MTVQCCKCNRSRQGTTWTLRPAVAGEQVSHTYCPECFETSMAEIRAERKRTASKPLTAPFSVA